MNARAIGRAGYWASMPLLCLAIYWPGLLAWFQADDFAWLSLRRDIAEGQTFLGAMFAPLAQGTIRPWSERGFFLLFQQLFGLDALPWRVFVFLVACASVLLLVSIARQMTCSSGAGLAAGGWWLASIGLAVPMAWTSDFNQILCAFFLLLAFHARLRGAYWTEFVVFVLGFGALEINVVYPAIALVWVVLTRDWRALRQVAAMFAVSVAYFAWHSHVAAPAASGPYAMHFDASIFVSFCKYLWWSLGSDRLWVAVLGVALVAAIALERRVALFGTAWFLCTLGPLLPLRDHVTEYYLAIPAIGLGFVAAGGVKKSKLAVAVVVLYVVVAAPAAYRACKWYADRSERVRTLVLGTVTAREKNPGKAILLDGIDEELFDTAIAHPSFHALYLNWVYLSSQTKGRLHPPDNIDSLDTYVLPPGPTLRGLASGSIAVYRVNGNRLRNVTTEYEEASSTNLRDETPKRVDMGNPLMAYLLGPGWYSLESEHRWMPREASLRVGGPLSSQSRLLLSGYCPEEQWRFGPLRLLVSVDGKLLLPVEINKPESSFTRTFSIPGEMLGRESVTVHLDVDRTVRLGKSEARELGLAFGIVEMQ